MRETLESAKFKQCLRSSDLPPLGTRFACAALLLEASGQYVDAGWEYLHVAWTLDDNRQFKESADWRNHAVNCWRSAIDTIVMKPDLKADLSTVMVDCLRRAGRGLEALPIIDTLLGANTGPVMTRVLHYQRRLIEHGDVGRHTIDEC